MEKTQTQDCQPHSTPTKAVTVIATNSSGQQPLFDTDHDYNKGTLDVSKTLRFLQPIL
jgi:hypothetical protein